MKNFGSSFSSKSSRGTREDRIAAVQNALKPTPPGTGSATGVPSLADNVANIMTVLRTTRSGATAHNLDARFTELENRLGTSALGALGPRLDTVETAVGTLASGPLGPRLDAVQDDTRRHFWLIVGLYVVVFSGFLGIIIYLVVKDHPSKETFTDHHEHHHPDENEKDKRDHMTTVRITAPSSIGSWSSVP